MQGIVIKNNMVHHAGAGAYTGATEGPSTAAQGPSSGQCLATPVAAGPCDLYMYDHAAAIAFDDFCSAGPAQDGRADPRQHSV